MDADKSIQAAEVKAEDTQVEAPLFEQYVVKVDVSISAAEVPTGGWPTGY